MWKRYEFLILLISGLVFLISGILTVFVSFLMWNGDICSIGLVPIVIGLILLGNAISSNPERKKQHERGAPEDAPLH